MACNDIFAAITQESFSSFLYVMSTRIQQSFYLVYPFFPDPIAYLFPGLDIKLVD